MRMTEERKQRSSDRAPKTKCESINLSRRRRRSSRSIEGVGAQVDSDFRDGPVQCALHIIHDPSIPVPLLSERACRAHAREGFTLNAAFFLELCHNHGSLTSKETGKEGRSRESRCVPVHSLLW